MTLAVLSDLAKPNFDGMSSFGLLFGLVMFIGFCIAAFTMPFKYYVGKKRENKLLRIKNSLNELEIRKL